MKIVLVIAAALLISACAKNEGAFPSLAPRDIEKVAVDAPVTPVADTRVSDPVVVARVNAALGKAENSVAGFNEALAAARTAAARSGGYGSDGWVAAQMAVSRAERTREPVKLALGDLTEEQRIVLFAPNSADGAAVKAALNRVAAIDVAQAAALDAVTASLRKR